MEQQAELESLGHVRIFTRTWRPPTFRAAVVLVHGFNSHSGYYEWVASKLVANGLAVTALDLRGRGRSGGARFYVDTFDEYVADIAALVAHTKASMGAPTYLLGHSAGGVASCLYALRHQSEIAGLICESFAYRLPAPEVALAVLKGLSHVAPHARVLKLKNADFSRDRSVVERMDHDALIAGETQPLQTLAAMVRADELLTRSFADIRLPVLILHGTNDNAAQAAGSQQFYDLAGSADKTLKLYEGYYHDLLNDVGKETVMADVLQWLDQRIGATAAKRARLTTKGVAHDLSRNAARSCRRPPADAAELRAPDH